MTKFSLIKQTSMIAAMLLIAAATAASANAAAPGAAPVSRILVVDMSSILAGSKVGASIRNQVNALKQQAQSQLNGEGEALKRDRAQLEQQSAILAKDVKDRKIKDWQARAIAFQKKVQDRGALIQGGMYKANKQIEDALGPILEGIIRERQATLLLDRRSVLIAPPGIDVTPIVIQRLDMKLPAIKVEPQPLPPELQQAAARQQQAEQ
jgi:outer membrane protein